MAIGVESRNEDAGDATNRRGMLPAKRNAAERCPDGAVGWMTSEISGQRGKRANPRYGRSTPMLQGRTRTLIVSHSGSN
jgi:hypothetical protein